MKKVSLALVTLILSFILFAPAFAAEAPKVVLNGQALTFDVQPTVINGVTFVPVRVIFESLGCIVVFDSKSQTVGAVSVLDGAEIELIINGKASVNSIDTPIDAPARIISGRAMVPLRFVGESLGANVKWDKKSNTISISNEKCKLVLGETEFQNSSFKIVLPKDWVQVSEENQDGVITQVFSKDINSLGGINTIMVNEIENIDNITSIEDLSEAFVSAYIEQFTNAGMPTNYKLLSKETIQNKSTEAILSNHSLTLSSVEDGIDMKLPLKMYVLTTKTSEKLFIVMVLLTDPQTSAWTPVLKESLLSFEPMVTK